jgi:hypothetical protein
VLRLGRIRKEKHDIDIDAPFARLKDPLAQTLKVFRIQTGEINARQAIARLFGTRPFIERWG